MSRTGALILLGLLIILTPFSGIPVGVRAALSIIFGVSVLLIGLSLRVREAAEASMPSAPLEPPQAPLQMG